jgi:ketosteroid isomerase-like protein
MQNRNLARCLAILLVSLSFVATVAGSNERLSSLTPADYNAIRSTIEAYRTTWLANDAKGVLKTFSGDAVLMPAHGTPAVVGIAAIEKYWFTPGGPVTTVTGLDITVDEIDGNAALAFARGADRVTRTE